MHKEVHFSIFDESEEKRVEKIRKHKDKILAPLVAVCKKYDVKPDTLSYLGLLMVFPFVYFFSFNPWLALIFMLLNMFFDGLDGSVARHTKIESVRGDVLEHAIDYLSLLIYFFTFLYFGLFDVFWGSFYIVNYVIMSFLIIIMRGLEIKVFPVLFRARWFLFGVFALWLFLDVNIFDPFLVLVGVYLLVTNVFLFNRIRCSL